MTVKRLTIFSFVSICLTLAVSILSVDPCKAGLTDCENDRFNSLLNADATYTSTFRSWYFGDPTTCTQQCNSIQDPQQRQTCLNNLSSCISSCDASRHTDYLNAQDGLMSAASQSCSYDPDQCAAARARRDYCVSNFNAQMQNPVLDENGDIDTNWAGFVMNEYSACWMASGVDQCE